MRTHANAIRTITCEGCGQIVTKRMPKGIRFCSPQCAAKEPRPYRQTGENHLCAICGKEVYIPRNRLGKPRYFCSPEHANEWQGRNKIEYTCKVCSQTYRVSPSRKTWDNPTYCSMKCRDADPESQARLIEMNAEQQRGHQTEPERIGYAILDSLSIEYLPQHVIGGKFCVDAFVPAIGMVIQFDGDYWHCNPSKFQEPDARQRKRIRLDQSQDRYMQACGYGVLRIWESDLRTAPERVREAILHVLPPTDLST